MTQADLIAKTESFLRASLRSPWKIDSDHSACIRLSCKQDVDIELQFDSTSIDLRFGISGELFEFEDYESEEALFGAILKLLNEIVAEERVSVQYKWLFMAVGGIYPISKMEELKGKRGFECLSWNGTYNNLKDS